jgi:hypothetical protein
MIANFFEIERNRLSLEHKHEHYIKINSHWLDPLFIIRKGS